MDVWSSAPGALPYQCPVWLRCVCAVDGWQDASRLYRAPDGRRLVLPMVRRQLLGAAVRIQAALPDGWGPGGLLSEDGVVTVDDVRMVMAELAEEGAMRSQIRPDPTMAAVWRAGVPAGVRTVPRMFQSVDLSGGFDDVWRTAFRSDTRNRVRKAQRAGVVIERDDTGRLLPAFERLYALSVERWAQRDGRSLPAAQRRAARREPPRKLETVAAAMGKACRVYAALVEGRPVAAIVVLRGQTTSAYWRGAMDADVAGRTYANYLLHSTAIDDAAADKHLVYHMGDSAPGSPLALFKSRFGAAEHHYDAYRLDRPLLTHVARARRGVLRVLARGSRG